MAKRIVMATVRKSRSKQKFVKGKAGFLLANLNYVIYHKCQ